MAPNAPPATLAEIFNTFSNAVNSAFLTLGNELQQSIERTTQERNDRLRQIKDLIDYLKDKSTIVRNVKTYQLRKRGEGRVQQGYKFHRNKIHKNKIHKK